ncbi:MAG: argininosuccinate lyase [Candidatus Carbobacillus altaicus]|nr:argininosuccinate lyase [Candidatus Carbobacillus altaicus]
MHKKDYFPDSEDQHIEIDASPANRTSPKKLWGGAFSEGPDEDLNRLNASLPFDQKLVLEDIEGSMAHATMLGAQGIIPREEAEAMVTELKRMHAEAQAGKLVLDLADEDIHMNIERELIRRLGPVGGKLHTARSRNDQVALDMHLYVKRQSARMIEFVRETVAALIALSEAHIDTVMPGYTHLKRAQPVSLAHHLLAYGWMLERDKKRFEAAYRAADRSPLGAGALSGTTFPINPAQTAALLGLAETYPNSMDAVSNRDFVLDFMYAATVTMIHLSRLSEEIILWASDEFQFVTLPDAYATGSSMMPQKKNPDLFELIRGKSGRVTGHLMGLLMVMKGLPLTYNKDLQEDKEGLFDTVETLEAIFLVLPKALRGLVFHRERMRDAVRESYALATELADFLAQKGVPFREAHHIVGGLVKRAMAEGKRLDALSEEIYREAHPLFTDEVYSLLDPETAIRRRMSAGGTGRTSIETQLAALKSALQLSDRN